MLNIHLQTAGWLCTSAMLDTCIAQSCNNQVCNKCSNFTLKEKYSVSVQKFELLILLQLIQRINTVKK